MPLGNGHVLSVSEIEEIRAQNLELRRLLEKHQWTNVTPVNSYGACPECGGSEAPFASGHNSGCAIAAALDQPAL
ncbi:MAG TPA: hypothetical protein VMD09_14310 [Solirubrobacteraceae bacterium]|nr:hypothetical protein [Solirubrobacteraceae bacterium]